MSHWTVEARDELLGRRRPDGGWSYRAGGASATEPSVLAVLALLATSPESSSSLESAKELATTLARRQRPDGGIGITDLITEPAWCTPYALLAWLVTGTHSDSARRAEQWLLRHEGVGFKKPPGSPLGHDTTLVGWSWAEGTHSWIEPTALAVIALSRAGQAGHPRVSAGRRLIQDRFIPGGGWNYGNNRVFGTILRPRPAPTGLALLALAGSGDVSHVVDESLDYLSSELVGIRSASSLGLGLLGLMAFNRRPALADQWLGEAYERCKSRPDGGSSLPYLMLASTIRSITLLGIDAPKGERHG